MKVTLLIPGALRTATDGASHLDVDVPQPATLGAALDLLVGVRSEAVIAR